MDEETAQGSGGGLSLSEIFSGVLNTAGSYLAAREARASDVAQAQIKQAGTAQTLQAQTAVSDATGARIQQIALWLILALVGVYALKKVK